MIENEDTPTMQRATAPESNTTEETSPQATTPPTPEPVAAPPIPKPVAAPPAIPETEHEQATSIEKPPSQAESSATSPAQQQAPTSPSQKPAAEKGEVADSTTRDDHATEPAHITEPSVKGDQAATIQVPTVSTPSGSTAATVAPAVPYLASADLLQLRIASDPQISPDGMLIAFVVQQCHAEQNTTSSAIWLTSTASGKTAPAQQISSGEQRDTTPRWSPDGRMLGFLSDRTGTRQLYLLPMRGGEAHQVTTLAQDVSEYHWRPDGQAILVHSLWKPADDQPTAESGQTMTVYTRLDTRHDGLGHTQGRHQQCWLLTLDGAIQRLTSEPVDLQQSCWSPDGSEIVFCANRRNDPDLNAGKALWVLTLASGQLRRLTSEEGWAAVPAWSPDGQTIAYLSTKTSDGGGNFSPWIVSARGNTAPRPAATGAEQLNCQSWIIDELRSEWLPRPRWLPDSKHLILPVQERGQMHLYRIGIEDNTINQITGGNGRYLSPDVSQNGQVIALIRADWFTPGDVWSIDGEGKNARKLTRINDAFLQNHQLIRPRKITWPSFDGLTIEGWLYLPPQTGQGKAPLIVVPHGGPALAWGDSYVHEFQVLAGRGYAVLAPNPRGSAGYGEEFSRKVINDWGGGDWKDILAGIDYVIANEPVDGNRIGIEGISYGGYMTSWAITQSKRFKAAVSCNGVSSLDSALLLSDHTLWYESNMPDANLRRERSPLTHVEQIDTPLLLLHAEDDLECPFSESLQLFVALRRLKRRVALIQYKQTSHLMDWPTVGLPQQRIDRLRRTVEWFESFV